jgi:hypothetical protein
MRNINLVAFVVATLISSVIANAQTTAVDSSTVGKNKKIEVVSAKTTVKTTKAEIKGLQKLIKEKKDLIELTQKQMPNVGDKNQRKALGDSVKVWNKQISAWNKEIKTLEKRKKGEDVDIVKAKKGFDRVMVQDTTAKITTTNPSIAKDTTTTAADPLKKGTGTNSKPSTPTKGASIAAKTATVTAANTASNNDTTPARPQAEADFIKRNYAKHSYGADVEIPLVKADSIGVQTFQNVKSRSGKTETQWGITVKHSDGSVSEYLVSGEDPTEMLNDKLTLAATDASGTAKASVHHGDGPDGDLSSSELE